MDLVVLAGGMGSRFGGAKQIEGIDEENNFIMDYSIFDAIECCFENIVIICQEKHKKVFESTVLKRVKNKVKVKFVIQNNDILQKYGVEREKPLGTAHAILCAKDAVKDNFCVINADDFYGRGGFELAQKFLENADKQKSVFANIVYKLKNTLSENGAVKRGICEVEEDDIKKIIECSIETIGGKIYATELDTNKKFCPDENAPVSMNMFCLTPKIFDFLQSEFEVFADNLENLKSKEFLLPRIIDKMCSKHLAELKMVECNEKWIGMTYKEDKKVVVDELKKLKNCGLYPKKLWE